MDAIRLEGITKSYRIGVGKARVREMMPWPADAGLRRLFPRWWTRNTFHAIEDVSLTVPSGSCVGVVGHNGAGKTTLLKVIAGVTAADRGTMAVSGRIAALLDVLVGFHPDLTGRENVYLLGAMHGFRRRAMATRMDRILDFAEIGELADTPLKRYSAGMSSRLGFAILTALDVDIMLVDEVLAVGDASFQQKCTRWLDEFRRDGGTLLFVSHNLSLVRTMTDTALWLDHGKVAAEGSAREVLAQYAKAMERRDSGRPIYQKWEEVKSATARGMHRWGAGGARVGEVLVEGPDGNGGGLKVFITFESTELAESVFCVGFLDDGGNEIGGAISPPVTSEPGTGSIRCRIRPLPLRPGIYFPVISILSRDGQVRDRWRLDRAVVVERDSKPAALFDVGPFDITAQWSNR